MNSATSPAQLGTMDIKKLLVRYAVPSIIAMTAASLYNMVDSMFIGHGVGAEGLTGLSLTLPLMNISSAFGSLVGVGGATLMSVKLGQHDTEQAKRILGNVVLLNLIIGAFLTIVALTFLDNILYNFGASEHTIVYARQYMQVIIGGNIITASFLGLVEMLRATGHPTKAMLSMLIAVILNSILDYFFIFHFNMGIRGAAIATIIAQMVSLTFVVSHFFKKSSFIHFEKGMFGLDSHLVKGIIAIGLSPFLMNVCSSGVVALINLSLKEHGGDIAIGAYGIVNRFFLFFIMINMGFNQGMQPIAGYNFGAGNYDRLKKVLKYTIFCAVTCSTIGFLLGQIFPGAITRMFTTNVELTDIAERGLHLVLLLFPLVGFQMVSANFFQSIGMAKKAIFLALSRQLLFLIPFLLVMPRFLGTDGVWLSIPFADCVSVIVTAYMLKRELKRFN